MKNFYKRCLKLRDFYLKMELDNTKLLILSNLVGISFYNSEHELDGLPRNVTFDIDCSALTTNVLSVEQAIACVLSDLEFNDFDIWHDKNYNTFPQYHFTING